MIAAVQAPVCCVYLCARVFMCLHVTPPASCARNFAPNIDFDIFQWRFHLFTIDWHVRELVYSYYDDLGSFALFSLSHKL